MLLLLSIVVTISGDEESEEFRKIFESTAKRVGDINEFEERLGSAADENEKLSILMEYIAFEMQSNFSTYFIDEFYFITFRSYLVI